MSASKEIKGVNFFFKLMFEFLKDNIFFIIKV